MQTCNGGSLKNGGSASTISMTIIPKDHMSTSGPYKSLEMTSGLILENLNFFLEYKQTTTSMNIYQ
jgi:hypothetical protein